MLKAIKVRIYPNNNQIIYLNKLLGCYRFVYNNCLALKIEKYNLEKKNVGLKELGNYFHQILTKDEQYSFYYARDVIKGRWPPGEAAIATDKKYAKIYENYGFNHNFKFFLISLEQTV